MKIVLDCGGKRSATPLSGVRRASNTAVSRKRRRRCRSAGALQTLRAVRWMWQGSSLLALSPEFEGEQLLGAGHHHESVADTPLVTNQPASVG